MMYFTPRFTHISLVKKPLETLSSPKSTWPISFDLCPIQTCGQLPFPVPWLEIEVNKSIYLSKAQYKPLTPVLDDGSRLEIAWYTSRLCCSHKTAEAVGVAKLPVGHNTRLIAFGNQQVPRPGRDATARHWPVSPSWGRDGWAIGARSFLSSPASCKSGMAAALGPQWTPQCVVCYVRRGIYLRISQNASKAF